MLAKNNKRYIKNKCKEVEILEIESKEITGRVERLRAEIKDMMREEEVDSYIFDDGSEKDLKVSYTTNCRISYDLVKIQNSLSKKKLAKVSDALYMADEDGLKEFLKENPEMKDELKKFIKKAYIINEGKLAKALNENKITKEEISTGYKNLEYNTLRIQRVKKKNE